jgi:hypothetical protein
MKPFHPVTLPALLEDVFMRFAMLDTLEHYSPQQIRDFASSVLQEQQHGGGKYSV